MKKFTCPICKKSFTNINSLIDHVNVIHPGIVPEGITTKQFLFNLRNKLPAANKYGKSILSKKPTKWNEEAGRYDRLCDEKERLEFRKLFVSRMVNTYGKETLLRDPEFQKKMLAGRKISGKYRYSDGREFEYTGSYEEDFIRFMDEQMNWDSKDIFMPCPFVINYTSPRDNQKHFYIPDAYIESLNLVVEIKSEENKHYRQRDLDIEIAKDRAMNKKKLNYVKVFDKDYENLVEKLKEEKD